MASRATFPAVALIVSLAGCGGSSSPTAPASPTPQKILVAEGSQNDVGPVTEGIAFFVIVQTPVTGVLEAMVDWTFPSNPVAVAWAQGNCSQDTNCTVIAQNTTNEKPKTVTSPNLTPGTYTLAVLNLGTTNESVSYQIFFTR